MELYKVNETFQVVASPTIYEPDLIIVISVKFPGIKEFKGTIPVLT
jgi:hypothetical protein